MRFVVDAQLPPGLAAHLRERGHAADHVNRIGLGNASDVAIWQHIRTTGAVLITKEEDFVAFALRDQAGPQLVWLRVGNISSHALWRTISAALDEILDALKSGERIVEVV
jgi:predicted nuclease of predicted toxin-antitoxin system